MSNDLISRQAVIGALKRQDLEFMQQKDIQVCIEDTVSSIPVAYDVDKVVEQLEEERKSVPINRVLDDITNDNLKELGKIMAYSKSIKLVKAGGKDD